MIDCNIHAISEHNMRQYRDVICHRVHSHVRTYISVYTLPFSNLFVCIHKHHYLYSIKNQCGGLILHVTILFSTTVSRFSHPVISVCFPITSIPSESIHIISSSEGNNILVYCRDACSEVAQKLGVLVLNLDFCDIGKRLNEIKTIIG